MLKDFFTDELRWHLELCPFLPLPLSFNPEKCLAEALAKSADFVRHSRHPFEDPKAPAWKSLDLDPQSSSFPATLNFLNSVTDLSQCHKVQFRLLEPGARLRVRLEHEGPGVGIFLALNDPQACEFYLETDDTGQFAPWTKRVPFSAGEGMLINVGKSHVVENRSSEPQIHLVIDGPLRLTEDLLLEGARKQNKVSGLKGVVNRVLLKKAQQPGEDNSILFETWRQVGLDKEVVQEAMHFVVLKPDSKSLPDDVMVRILNMTRAGLFPLIHAVVDALEIDSYIRSLFAIRRPVVIVGAGTFIRDPFEFVFQTQRTIAQMREKDCYLAGSILDPKEPRWKFWKKSRLPQLHEELTIIDLTQVQTDQVGHFSFSNKLPSDFPSYERSPQVLGSSSAPFWLKSSESTKSVRGLPGWGTGLISRSLKMGRAVVTLMPELQKAKTFSHPKRGTKDLSTIESEIFQLLQSHKKRVSFFDSEPLKILSLKSFRPTNFYSVASGFKPFSILNQYWFDSTPEKIVFLDPAPSTLSSFKELSKKISLQDLTEFVLSHNPADDRSDSLTAERVQSQVWKILKEGFSGDEKVFLSAINKIARAEFHQMDIVHSFKSFLDLLAPNEKFLFWHSDAWLNSSILYLKSSEWLRQEYKKMGLALGQRYEQTVWSHKTHHELLIGNDPESPMGVVTCGSHQNNLRIEDYEMLFVATVSPSINDSNRPPKPQHHSPGKT